MLTNQTSFNTNEQHIHLECIVTHLSGSAYIVDAVLDTGAPRTEFSDRFLIHTGFIEENNTNISIKPGLQSQKYGMLELPSLIICDHRLTQFEVFISRFESAWGIDALIGLDFFRRFEVTIDYRNGRLITSAYKTV